MINIKCAKCNKKIFKYNKIGKGRVLTCWASKITKDYSVRKDNSVYCGCGNHIGIIENENVKMKQGSFNFSGTILKK